MNEVIEIDEFKIIGVSVQTTNIDGKSSKDMGELWGKFFKENVQLKIPNKINENIYSLYTDYTSDYNGEYTAIIGCKVSNLKDIPDGLVGYKFAKGRYVRFTAKGIIPESIIKSWQEIWRKDKDLDRKYSVDFELYEQKSQQEEKSEVDIFISAY